MTIKVGDKLPDGKLWEFVDEETPGCSIGPNEFDVAEQVKGKRIAVFALPGAFTPTCSAKHLPGYVEKADELKKKVDEIWCLSVNDAFVMGAWGRANGATGKVRMMADGNGDLTKALGMELDLTARGIGVRSQRYSMLLEDGKVKALNVEEGGKFEVSDADTMLKQA
ncbi:MAG: peroxiredoxin [Betaproteobacteria bacterium]|jgi:peroxiredoxin|nr:MAG: peroxiredoxin [Betaproteobacteria bacterium]